jgi:hypothetical protein
VTAYSRTILAVLLLAPAAVWAQAQPQLPAADLVKAVIANEIKPSSDTDVRWKYRLEKEVDGRRETREVAETKSGSLDKLVAVDGRTLNEAQQRAEAERVLRLARDTQEQRKAQVVREKDAEQCNRFMQMIPNAFTFEYAGQSGNLIKVVFRPHPGFQASSREAKVLQQMAGEMWIDAGQKRLVSIDGQLTNEVKFAGGFLGHLEKGGRFFVKREELAQGDWEVTQMSVNMHGKALLFKNICVQQKETHSNFERLPSDITLADAANLLLRQALIASVRR